MKNVTEESDEPMPALTAGDADRIWAAAPPAVRDEIERELAESHAEMLRKLEEHAVEFEAQSQ